MVFQKRGGLTLISRIVLFFLVIGFIALIIYTINYEEPKIPVTIINTSSSQVTNESVILTNNQFLRLSIPQKTNFSATVNRCEDEDVVPNATISYGDVFVNYNPFLEQVNFVDGEFIVFETGDIEKREFVIENNFYVLTVIGDEEKRFSLLEYNLEFEGILYFRFNSICQGSYLNLSWGEQI